MSRRLPWGAVAVVLAASCSGAPAPDAGPVPPIRPSPGPLVADIDGVGLRLGDGFSATAGGRWTARASDAAPARFVATVGLAAAGTGRTSFTVHVNGEAVLDELVSDRHRVAVDVPAGATVTVVADPAVLVGGPALVVPRPAPRRIVLVVVDTLRADHLGAWGYPRPTSPRLDALAASGARASRCLAPAPWTLPSTRAIVSGAPPYTWSDHTPTVLTQLWEAGWTTASISRNPWLGPANGVPRGADLVDATGPQPAAPTVDRAVAWLRAESDRDAALLLHLMDPHAPYAAPGPLAPDLAAAPPAGGPLVPRKQALEDAYDAEIRYVDAEIGRLADALEALPGDHLLVVTSDHGEEFWEHGGVEHGHSLHGELLHVPLIVAGDRVPSARTVDAPTSLLDVAPTILTWAGLPTTGRDLLAAPLAAAPPLFLGETIAGAEAVGLADAGERYWLQAGDEHRFAADDLTDTVDLADAPETAAWRRKLAERFDIGVRPGAVFVVPQAARAARPELDRFELDWGAAVVDARVVRGDGYTDPTAARVAVDASRATLTLPTGASAGMAVALDAPARPRVPVRAGGAEATLILRRARRPRIALAGGPALPVRVGAGPVAWPGPNAPRPAPRVVAGSDRDAPQGPDPRALRALGYVE